MLRESIKTTGAGYKLDGIKGDGDGGIPEGELLCAFAEAVIGFDDDRAATARSRLIERLGPAAAVDAAGVIATFNAIDRVADATGTPIDEERIAVTADLRADLGIDGFPSATST